jgi:16S rRNA (guanine527-N7)-methyltransferase
VPAPQYQMSDLADSRAIEGLLRGVVSGLVLELSDRQMQQLASHFSLLLHWNRKINLTSLRRPEEIATRHFGESLFLVKILPLGGGLMVDVGSGAGFPGLPLQVASPTLQAVLLEPNQKKAAFLKEVVRSGGMEGVEIRAERLQEAVQGDLLGRASLVTMRAVAAAGGLLADLKKLLGPGGRLALFLGAEDAAGLAKEPGFHWETPVAIPNSERRVVLIGRAAVSP